MTDLPHNPAPTAPVNHHRLLAAALRREADEWERIDALLVDREIETDGWGIQYAADLRRRAHDSCPARTSTSMKRTATSEPAPSTASESTLAALVRVSVDLTDRWRLRS